MIQFLFGFLIGQTKSQDLEDRIAVRGGNITLTYVVGAISDPTLIKNIDNKTLISDVNWKVILVSAFGYSAPSHKKSQKQYHFKIKLSWMVQRLKLQKSRNIKLS